MATRFNNTQLLAARTLLKDVARMADNIDRKLTDRSIEDAIKAASALSDKAHQFYGLVQDFVIGGDSHKFSPDVETNPECCGICGWLRSNPIHKV